MLDAGRPPQRFGGLILFSDHADPRRYYVVAERPTIVSDPIPQIALSVFRSQAGGGGLLQFQCELAPSQEQMEAARSELARQAGKPPALVRPDWQEGRIRIAGWLDEEELAPLLLSVGPPSLVGDPLALVSARLDEPATALASRALRGDALPTLVVFELETLGLAGPLAIEAEADVKAIHDRLKAAGALTTPYGAARLSKTWEEFVRENLIRITIVDESLDVEQQRSEALRRIGEDLVFRMLSPSPPPERPPQLDDAPIAAIELSFRLTARREELDTTARWSFLERRAVRVRHFAAASLLDFLKGRPASDHISFVDLAEEEFEITVRAEPDFRSVGIVALEVELKLEGDDEEETRTLVLTPEAIERRWAVSRPPGGSFAYRVRARYDPQRTLAQDRQTDWQRVDGRTALISIRRLFPPRTLSVILGRVELDWLDQIEIVVEAPGELPQTVLLNHETRSRDCYFPAAGPGPCRVFTQWRGRLGEPSRSEPPRETEEALLVLDSPFGDSIHVLVVPLPLPSVLTTVAELKIEHDGFSDTKSASWEAPDRTPKELGLRRLAGSPRRYAYRVSFLRLDGSLETGPWIDSSQSTLVVGGDGPVHVTRVEVVLLGGGPAERGSLAVELELKSGDLRVSELLEGSKDSVELFLITPVGTESPVLNAREFMASGEVVESTWQDPGNLVVLPVASPTDH